MKVRSWSGGRTWAGLPALLVALVALIALVAMSATASGQPTLRMRTAPVLLAQAPQPAPTPPAPPPPASSPSPEPDVVPAGDAVPAPADEASPPTLPIVTTPPPSGAAPLPEDIPIAAEVTPPTEGEVIIVTGSRIGDPLGKQAPVLMLSREDLDRTGLTSVGDILQQLPVSGGAINGKFNSSGNFGLPPDGGGIGAGAVEADLRYLGSKRVLVLVDGVRWINGASASGVPAATDLNTIPIGIVDRIEVLEDGASPIYGSDAISGVINIITRKEFTGAIASVYTGGFHQGDGLTQKYDLSWGSATPKLSIVFGASFLDQRAVASPDREISKYAVPGVAQCTTRCSSRNPQGEFKFTDPTTGTKRDIVPNPGVGMPTGLSDYHNYELADRFNFAPYNLVETPSRRMGAFSSLTYKLSPVVNLRGKTSFTNRQSVNQAAPEPLSLGPQGANGNRRDRIGVDVTNPYNPFGFSLDPASNLSVIARRPVEAGPRKFEQDVDTFYVSGGLDGHVDVSTRRFTWEATLAYGLNHATQRRNNAFNSAKLQEALGPAYLGSDGVYHCGTMANPGNPNCVPFNIFGGQGADGRGTITKEMLAFTTFTEHDVSEQKLVDAVANVTGNLIQVPAGWLAAAVGVEHRRLSGFYEPDAVIAAGDGADIASSATSGRYSVSEAYAELRAPLISGLTGAELVDVNTAVRLSDYSFLSPELTGKLGVRWKPMKDLIVRGSYSRGFRAPSIGELFGSKAGFGAVIVDPCSKFNSAGVPPDVRERCIALGVPADGSYGQNDSQIRITTAGNRALQPETSNSVNVSLAYSPSFLQDRPWVDSLDLELAYFDIRLHSAISALDAQYQIDRCVAGGDDSYCGGIERNAQGTIFSFGNELQNLGGINVRGLDLALTYRMPRRSFGRFRVTSQSSYLIAYEERVPSASGFQTIDRSGKITGTPERAYPKLKSALAITWLYPQIELTLRTRYIHSMTESCRDLSGFPGTCSDPNATNDALSTNKLRITVYNDVQATWSPDFDHQLSVTAGVNNLLNRDPPSCYSCSLNGFNGATYDVPGIFGYLAATYHLQ